MTFQDLEHEKPIPLLQCVAILVTFFLFALAVTSLTILTGCGSASDEPTQSQTVTIVAGNDLSVDCSDSSTEIPEEEEDEDTETVVVAEDDATPTAQSSNCVPPLCQQTPITPARVRADLVLVQSYGYLPTARVQECNGGQIIANGVDANVDIQIDEIEEIAGEGALVRLLRFGHRM